MPDSLAAERIVVSVSCVLAPIYPLFLEMQREQLGALGFALGGGDTATACRLAHNAKGAAGTYELPDAAALANELEIAIAGGDLNRAGRLLGELDGYFAALDVAFTDVPPLPDA